ncbi:hypothetical protein AAG570_001280 [Ranatra chinensis]|uniref:Uncharacterized protein n=1 Tax=Ranatra chinensis TaxID=642074 RepID=A0ABD0YBQ3_9HEMI
MWRGMQRLHKDPKSVISYANRVCDIERRRRKDVGAPRLESQIAGNDDSSSKGLGYCRRLSTTRRPGSNMLSAQLLSETTFSVPVETEDFLLWKTATKTLVMLKTAYGDDAMSILCVYDRISRFKNGEMSIMNAPYQSAL